MHNQNNFRGMNKVIEDEKEKKIKLTKWLLYAKRC